MLDVHAALEKDPAVKDMDPLARRGFAHCIVEHLVQAGLLFRRGEHEPSPSAEGRAHEDPRGGRMEAPRA